jgi:transmembrane sensor
MFSSLLSYADITESFMDIEKYRVFTTEDFILDEKFVQWVKNPVRESDAFWSGFLARYPEKDEEIKDAVFIIKGTQVVEQEIPAGRLESLFTRIEAQRNDHKKHRLVNLLKYAAVIAGAIGITGIIYLMNVRENPFATFALNPEDATVGKVILPDGSAIAFNTEETVINQTTEGELLINSDTIQRVLKEKGKADDGLNQVIIPYGQRSQITLADGSHIWLNSGSQLSYPTEFRGKSREVYLSGEALFEVAPDADKPFYVITKDIKIKVLGTKFNISAYLDEENFSAVLLEGKVTIGKNGFLAKTEDMKPGERTVYNKKSQVFTKELADINYYTSWLQGYLIFENEPTPGIFKKLERYYNQAITVEEGLDNITFSGKLDLKEDIEDVLESITYSSRVKITRDGTGYKVNR